MQQSLKSLILGTALAILVVACGSQGGATPTTAGGVSGNTPTAALTPTQGTVQTASPTPAPQNSPTASSTTVGKVKILLSMKGPGGGNPFWAAVEQGARDAAKTNGVDLVVLAPPNETDVQTQISQIEDQITAGVQAIVVAPTDPQALNPTLDKAKAKGIPVLFVDTDAPWPGKITFIGTDNKAGGQLAGQYICQHLSKSKKVAIITGVMTQQTHIDRDSGAKAALQACGAKIVAELPADSDRAKGQQVMEDILTSNPDLEAVFATNDLMALGAAEAAKAAGKLPGIIIVGFDANPDAAKSILAGEMSASIAQNPYKMGQLGIENALKAIKGQPVPPRIDTGTTLVTKDNAQQYIK
ncbi:sugar ABC transporter substrate-binding protein [Thermorudis peleae]|uniref:sugar ABC transporter substrate-binding protein n=1 Tax=Thermorudis peleae TaxID=1382356 RepID=UPI00056DAEDA|nr:sugar ABC transporter substrate-binding protein [Thermorudis peleae]